MLRVCRLGRTAAQMRTAHSSLGVGLAIEHRFAAGQRDASVAHGRSLAEAGGGCEVRCEAGTWHVRRRRHGEQQLVLVAARVGLGGGVRGTDGP